MTSRAHAPHLGPPPPPPGSPGPGATAQPSRGGPAAQPPAHGTPIYRSHATLQAFNAGTYLATITLTASPDTSIANVPVSRAIAAAQMVVGHVVCVIFFDHSNSADAMIVGIL